MQQTNEAISEQAASQVAASIAPRSWDIGTLEKVVSHYLMTGTCLLSPYPKEYSDNMAWRLKVLRRANGDSEFRERIRKLFHSDPLFAFNAFFYTLDVRQRPRHHRPFTTYHYQDLVILDLVEHIRSGRDTAGEKSRDMGFSWIVIGAFVWLWLDPEGGYDFLLGSRIEDYVDKKGDMRTLFEKARYLIYRLPWWLRPEGWNAKKHDNFMKLVNPQSGSSLTGESNNANFSTGGRYKAILLDEYAKWKDTDTSVWTATADASPCRVPISTPFGAFGQYFNVVTDGKTDKITAHWSLHPTKGEGLYCPYPKPADLPEGKEITFLNWKGQKPWLRSPWYDAETTRRDSRTIAQELDIDYIGAGSPVFNGSAATRIIELLRSQWKPIALYGFTDLGTMVELEQDNLGSMDYEGKLVVYELPTEATNEVLGVDVVEGKEHGDFAVIKALCRETRNCSFSYYSRVDEVTLAEHIRLINEWVCSYKHSSDLEPWIAIETNGPGLATFDLCVEKGLTNLFLTPNYDSVKESLVYQKGWRTTSSSRKKLVSSVKQWLLESRGWVDQRAVREMTSFVYASPNRPEAAAGTNDDEVIAWGICLAVDEILPGAEWKPPVARRADGLPANIFDLEAYRNKNEDTSVQGRCLAQAMVRQITIVPTTNV